MTEGKILVVDDNEIELRVLRIVLEAAGFEVALLDSVFELSLAIKRDRPDIILLDVMMPALRGDRAAAILKQHGFSRDIPVILHSSMDADELEKIATRAQVQGFVSKTGDFDHLLDEVRRVLGPRSERSGQPDAGRSVSDLVTAGEG